MNNPTFIGNIFGIPPQSQISGIGAFVISSDKKKRCSKNSNSPFATFNPCTHPKPKARRVPGS